MSNLQMQGVSTALIHSVVVLNISDQWTRTRLQHGSPRPVCGALLGKQTGRNIEIWNCHELVTSTLPAENNGAGQRLLVDEEYFVQRGMLYKETFPELEFLGFYVTGDHERTSEEDVHLQRQAWPHNESPFLLKFNAAEPVLSDKLSLTLFDSAVDPANEDFLIFQPIPIKITSELAEQIGLDHVARYSKTGVSTESTVAKQMGAQIGAINRFQQGLATAHDYVKAVQEGRLDRDETILREIQKLCLKLSIHSAKPSAESEREVLQTSDHKLLVLLSAICSTQGAMFQLIENVNVLARDQLHRERSSMMQHAASSMMGGGGGRVPHPHSMGGAHFPRFFF